jgi:hypothetical protein
MRASSPAPRTVAGIFGMLLVAALFITNALSLKEGGAGLGVGWLITLALPGLLAAHLCWRRGLQQGAVREGVLAGLLTAHFAALLQVIVLALAVLTTDWTRYAAQVGVEVASGVKDAAIPAVAVAAVAIVAISYGGCVLVGWLGAGAYVLMRRAAGRTED